MNFSFGIPLPPDYNTAMLQSLVNSIQYQPFAKEDQFEILTCGGDYRDDLRLKDGGIFRHILFNEHEKPKWITKKKNEIVQHSQYANICILHDYYKLGAGWYDGLNRCQQEHNDWDVLCSPIYTYEQERHSDWLVNQKYMDMILKKYPELEAELLDAAPTEENGARWVCGLPYSENELSHIQYVSGGYIFAKRVVFEEVPFDERYAWGEAAEDIIWSEQVIEMGFKIRLNRYSTLWLQKPGKWHTYTMTDSCIEKLKEMFPGEEL
jgi:hypothetical protein